MPRHRTLLQVQIDSTLETDKTFVDLLGKDPSQRYRFIMDTAALAVAEELDVSMRRQKLALHRAFCRYPPLAGGLNVRFSKRRETMTKRSVVGGIWAILTVGGLSTFGWSSGGGRNLENPHQRIHFSPK